MVYNFVSLYFTPAENFAVDDHRRGNQLRVFVYQAVAYFYLGAEVPVQQALQKLIIM